MSEISWGASYVGPGTFYSDEPDVEVPVGWYVTATDVEDDDRENAHRAEVFVAFAVDEDGNDVTGDVAARIARLMNAAEVSA